MSLYDELIKAENKSIAFPKLFDKLTIESNILANCTFELTPLCNFRCKFCYARLSEQDLKEKNVKVMRFDEWKRYIDELADMNCLTVAFTGGECTLHPDFEAIYSYAYDRGMVINLFTNGSHITDSMLEMFRQKPPSRIFLTMYGYSPEMYEKVTGSGKSFETVRNTVRRLAEMKFDVVLQGTFSEENLPDMEVIYDFAAELGLEYRYTTQLQQYGHCTEEMLEEIRENDDMAKELSRNIWRKKNGYTIESPQEYEKRRFAPIEPVPGAVGIKCNAGKNSCFIRHDGVMLACNTFDVLSVDTHGKSVRECFAELNRKASLLERIHECEGCIHAIHCTTCIAAHYNDTHKLGVPSPRICFKIREPEKAAEERAFFDEHGYLEI